MSSNFYPDSQGHNESSQASFRLSMELVDSVFSYADDTTLISCSLVCKTWLEVSRYRYFLRNPVEISKTTINPFIEIAKPSTNSISPHLRNISLIITSEGRKPEASQLPQIAEIIGKANVTRSLVVSTRSLGYAYPAATWDPLVKSLQSLRELKLLSSYRFPWIPTSNFMCRFPHLEKLRVYENGVDAPPSSVEEVPSATQKLSLALKELHLHFASTPEAQEVMVKWFTEHASLRTLSFLRIKGVPVTADAALVRFVQGSSSLQYLELGGISVNDDEFKLDLSNQIALHTLSVQPLGSHAISFLLSTLQTVKSRVLRTLTVKLRERYIKSPRRYEAEQPIDPATWAALDDLLAGEDYAGGGLQEVRVVLDVEKGREAVAKLFMGCEKKGLLKFPAF